MTPLDSKPGSFQRFWRRTLKTPETIPSQIGRNSPTSPKEKPVLSESKAWEFTDSAARLERFGT